jgi:hypothetical protein
VGIGATRPTMNPIECPPDVRSSTSATTSKWKQLDGPCMYMYVRHAESAKQLAQHSSGPRTGSAFVDVLLVRYDPHIPPSHRASPWWTFSPHAGCAPRAPAVGTGRLAAGVVASGAANSAVADTESAAAGVPSILVSGSPSQSPVGAVVALTGGMGCSSTAVLIVPGGVILSLMIRPGDTAASTTPRGDGGGGNRNSTLRREAVAVVGRTPLPAQRSPIPAVSTTAVTTAR